MIFKPFLREGFMPLPMAFISTISGNGVRNIAPYSCIMPVLRPLDLICPASAHMRAILKNKRETGELVVNKVLHLEAADEVLSPEGELDIGKTRLLMMTGGKKGMHFCTLRDIDRFEPFCAMFPNGKDPLVEKYT